MDQLYFQVTKNEQETSHTGYYYQAISTALRKPLQHEVNGAQHKSGLQQVSAHGKEAAG